jgi:LCP family protein required for cell wall assembly
MAEMDQGDEIAAEPDSDDAGERNEPKPPPESPPTSPARDGTEKDRPRRRRGLRILAWVAGGVALLLVAVAVAGYFVVDHLQGNIKKQHVENLLGPDRPVKLNSSMNILVLGSDSRAGQDSSFGSADIAGQRSDTIVLLHLSPNRDGAVGISFPRDSMVQMPACKKADGSGVPAQFGQINAAFSLAGAACTWRTIESLTHIHIDHYVQIDFAGFTRVVDALGGVPMCIPQPINDPRSNLSLRSGHQTLNGDEALGYVRTRYTLGDGSDLERIQRQQQFMAAVVRKATSSDTLTNPIRTYRFLDAITKSISTDDQLTLSVMRRLAGEAHGMSTGKVRFVTVPTEAYPKDPNRVQWIPAQAGPLFDAIRRDDRLPAPAPTPVPSSPAATPPVTGGITANQNPCTD